MYERLTVDLFNLHEPMAFNANSFGFHMVPCKHMQFFMTVWSNFTMQHELGLLLFICLAYVSLHALFVFDITFFPSGLISLHKIGLYISLRHNCSTDIQNIVVVFYED